MQAKMGTITEREIQRAENRHQRGMQLVWEHSREIWEVESGKWAVPASRGGSYTVRLGAEPMCSCRDWGEHGGSCKHITAARVMAEITPAMPAAPAPTGPGHGADSDPEEIL